jgi:hypothetical protein
MLQCTMYVTNTGRRRYIVDCYEGNETKHDVHTSTSAAIGKLFRTETGTVQPVR